MALCFILFSFCMCFIVYKELSHTHRHMPHLQHSLAIETLLGVHLVSMKNKGTTEVLCKHAVLGLVGLGIAPPVSNSFGFGFHQEVNNGDTFWV